jgi:hypothetical protein
MRVRVRKQPFGGAGLVGKDEFVPAALNAALGQDLIEIGAEFVKGVQNDERAGIAAFASPN